MDTYHGFRVLRSSSGDKTENTVGTIIYNKKFLTNDKVVIVQWDNCIKEDTKHYAIGYESKYQLLLYDNSYRGAKHDSFSCNNCRDNPNIIGTMWSCLNCADVSLCTPCYMTQTEHKDHNCCRFNLPNNIGYFVGRSKGEKYHGIVKDANVTTTASFQTQMSGYVDSIEFDYERKRPVITVKCNGSMPKVYHSYTKLKLDNNRSGASRAIELQIDKNHFKVMGHNSIFNNQLCQYYKEKLNIFASVDVVDNTNFDIGDTVYIDCFTSADLHKFQKGKGESNTKIEELIGKPGVVVQVEKDVVRIRYESLNGIVPINKKAIFNKIIGQKIMRITNEISLIRNEFKDWIDKFGEKAADEKWYPRESMFQMIKGKIGVIVLDGLPDNLVAVKFKMYRYSFCMLLPQSLCIDLHNSRENQCRLSQHVVNLDIQLTDSDKEIIEHGKILISENDSTNFEEKVRDISIPAWNELFHHAIELNRNEMIKILIDLYKTESRVTDYFLISFSRHEGYASDKYDTTWDFLLDNCVLDLTSTTPEHDNLLHLAAKNGYYIFIEKLLSRHQDDKNLLHYQTASTRFTALHYAAFNNNADIVRLLLEHGAFVYHQTKDKCTALHIALQQYYIDVLLTILEYYENKELRVDVADEDHNTILHLTASLPDEDMYQRWLAAVSSDRFNILQNAISELEAFFTKFKFEEDFGGKMVPVFILSCLLLKRGKNATKVWNQEVNLKTQTPAIVFGKSINDLNKGLNVTRASHVLRLFKIYQNENQKLEEMCHFCKADFARVTYKPCGHTLHCFHCSFMPYKCTECHAFITDKLIGDEKVNDFQSWTEEARNVTDIDYPENMNDWYKIVTLMLQQRLCQCCKEGSNNVVINCGHLMCSDCKKKTTKCCICREKITSSMEMKWI